MAKPKKYTVTDGELVLTLEAVDEGGYFVTAPFNPDVKTQADTLEEAFEMARDVIALFEQVRADERKGRGPKKPTPRRAKQKAG